MIGNRKGLAQRLVIAEDKKLIFQLRQDRPTDGEAGLLPQKTTGRGCRSAVESVVGIGIEVPIAIEPCLLYTSRCV